MQEREQPVIGFAFDPQIVEAVPARQRVAVEQRRGSSRADPEQRRAALAEQDAVVEFVDRVLQVQAAQQRIGREFRRAQDVAAAVGFDLGKR